MGVVTTGALPKRRVFGPIPTNLTLTDPAVLIGHMTADTRPDVHTVKVDINEYAEGARLAEWVPYVQAAREEREQNIEAYIKNGQLFYRTLRDIAPNTELSVWYSDDFAQILGVPEIQSIHFTENGTMCCPYCGQTFGFPFSLRAHLRFKCQTLRKAMHLDTSIRPSLTLYSSALPRPPLPGLMGGVRPPVTHRQDGLELSPTSSLTSSSLASPAGTPSPGNHSPQRATPTPVIGRGDRDRDRERERDRERDRERERERERERDRERNRETLPSQRTPERFESGRDSPDSRCSRSASPRPEDDTGSAFRKVERHPALSVPAARGLMPGGDAPRATGVPHFDLPHSSAGSLFRPPPPGGAVIRNSLLGLPHHQHDNNMNPSMATLYGAFPVPGRYPRPNENVPLNLAGDRKMTDMPRAMVDKLSDIRNIENNNVYRKMPFYSERRLAMNPYFKSHNPMVDKILHSPLAPIPASFASLSLHQNWCAKCNATFRMTSDLVYHMRSHHKREFDPLKRKREEKLRCDVCGETFRERHHLSRHMTSHL